ncbi:MAG TPA: prolyl aminopeptidase [Nitrococcus sp.]|nr:prolyl aminopeptidase [Nitrococcus sp.]
MDGVFPVIVPYRSGFLDTPDGQQIHFEESGSSTGLPVVIVHGGPASSTQPYRRRFFRSTVYRIIDFDQRGAGRSLPKGVLRDNTTAHLLDDMEALRNYLNVQQWVVFGGSWGATLALCYAQQHPDRVRALLVRGTLLGRARDLEWFFGARGVASILPEAYQRFLAPLPATCRDRPVAAYAELFSSGVEEARAAAAAAWAQWEASVVRWSRHNVAPALEPNSHTPDADRYAIAAMYAHNGFFLRPECGALHDPRRLADIPGFIIHGRLDLVCPVENATTLHQAWPKAKLQLIGEAGHLDAEPPLAAALVAAGETIAQESD